MGQLSHSPAGRAPDDLLAQAAQAAVRVAARVTFEDVLDEKLAGAYDSDWFEEQGNRV